MPKQKFEVEIDVPEGYKIKDFRIPSGEAIVIRVLQGTPTPVRIYKGYTLNPQPEFIIEKIPQYRDPVLPADWGKSARFSHDGVKWDDGILASYAAYYADDKNRWGAAGKPFWYKFCQVVDE